MPKSALPSTSQHRHFLELMHARVSAAALTLAKYQVTTTANDSNPPSVKCAPIPGGPCRAWKDKQQQPSSCISMYPSPAMNLFIKGPPSLDPTSLAKQYVSLCATPATNSSSPQLSKHHLLGLHGKGLAAAAEL